MDFKPGEIAGVVSGVFLVLILIVVTVVLLVKRKCAHAITNPTTSAVCLAGTAGPGCSYSDDITCNARGIAQYDGTCVCAQGQCGTDCTSTCSNAVSGTWSASTSNMGAASVVAELGAFTFGAPEVRRGFADVHGVGVDAIARTWYTYTSPGAARVELGFRTLPDGRKEVVFQGTWW